MASGLTGNCYLCGKEFGKTAVRNHLMKVHNNQTGGQKCCLLKIEGAYNKDYWLYIDVPVTSALSGVDAFLRKIWLECCGHMSAFFGPGHAQVSKNRKLDAFSVGDKLLHEYDFGSTIETLITVIGETTRKTQKESVRLLARNIPPVFSCCSCVESATVLCTECIFDSDNPFFCQKCGEAHEHVDMMLAVSNSPRMGVCGYEGELDIFTFNPQPSQKKRDHLNYPIEYSGEGQDFDLLFLFFYS
ncbi:MAG: hypothetical protein LBI04_06000 [Treponema sp.]|jgi:hypothetical protein|nr:hypothetical protein [Treponema sp.]